MDRSSRKGRDRRSKRDREWDRGSDWNRDRDRDRDRTRNWERGNDRGRDADWDRDEERSGAHKSGGRPYDHSNSSSYSSRKRSRSRSPFERRSYHRDGTARRRSRSPDSDYRSRKGHTVDEGNDGRTDERERRPARENSSETDVRHRYRSASRSRSRDGYRDTDGPRRRGDDNSKYNSRDGSRDRHSSARGRGNSNSEHVDLDTKASDGALSDAEEDDIEAQMSAMMGFGGFGSTKDKQVKGNNAGAVKVEKKAHYRQYMNRVGGFNRALSPSG